MTLTQARRARLRKRILRAAESSVLFSPWQRLARDIALSSGVIRDRLDTLGALVGSEDLTIAQAVKKLSYQDQGIFYHPMRSAIRSALVAGHTDGSHYRKRFLPSGYVDVASRMASQRAAQVDKLMRQATKNAYNDDPDITKFMFSPERALRAVRFETGTAYYQGLLASLSGLTEMKEWVTTSNDPCPGCIENEDVGLIPLSAEFPSGDMAPLLHPNCQCILSIQ